MLFSGASPRKVVIQRWLLVAISWIAYFISFPISFGTLGPRALAFSGVPVLITAWFTDLTGGVIGAIAITLINGLFMYWLGDYDWVGIMQDTYFGFLLLVFGGAIIGYTQELRYRLLNELKEKDRAAAKYQSIIMCSSDGIIIVSEEGRIIEWNKGQEQITGIRNEDVIGKLIWEVFSGLEDTPQRTPASKIQFF